MYIPGTKLLDAGKKIPTIEKPPAFAMVALSLSLSLWKLHQFIPRAFLVLLRNKFFFNTTIKCSCLQQKSSNVTKI